MYSPILVGWLRRILKEDEHIEARVLTELLEQVMPIPASDKSGYITELWHHFDAINDLLLSARRGENFFQAVRKLKRHEQYLRPMADRDLIRSLKAADGHKRIQNLISRQ
jgi:hypothetical protein